MKKILTIAVTTAAVAGAAAIAYAALCHHNAKKEIHAPDHDILVDESDLKEITK